jgi:hypothetical protein
MSIHSLSQLRLDVRPLSLKSTEFNNRFTNMKLDHHIPMPFFNDQSSEKATSR